MTCTTQNCFNKVLAKNLCTKCYYRIKRGGTPELSKKQQMALRTCSIKECTNRHFVHGLCSKHRMQERRKNESEKIKERGRATRYKKENKEKVMAWVKARAKRTKQATPSWVDLKQIQLFYLNCPKDHHVDHIIPLKGKNVSGLHVIENLQYLPASQNLSKSNKY